MTSPDRPVTAPTDEDARRDDAAQSPSRPLSMKGAFGTAVGSAMLGFEQALRDQPPAEVVVAEHTPDRRPAGGSDDLEIRFPERPDDADRQPPGFGR
jgi:hypothetical protein